LTSGDHAAIRRWREREALRATLEKRPDLLERPEVIAGLTREQREELRKARADACADLAKSK
jgi:tRNA (guanine37-N1)-methyltransferase